MPQKTNAPTDDPRATSVPQGQDDELEMADDEEEFEDEEDVDDDSEVEDEDVTEE